MANILQQIESKYPVETILVDGEQAWPYLRIRCYAAYTKKAVESYSEAGDTPQTPGAIRPIRTLRFWRDGLRSLRYGFRNWFRKYDYIVLTHTANRRMIDGKYFNRFLDPIVDEIGPDRVLWIEEAPPPRPPYNAEELHTRCVVSGSVLTRCGMHAMQARRWFRRGYTVVNRGLLDEIAADLGLDINATALIETYQVRRKVFTWFLRIMRPRALLLTCYYGGRHPAVKAAKSLGIKVVEVQHGVIGTEHPAYNVYRDIDRSCFPDHLLVFGSRELETFDNPRFIDPANVHPVGSFYLDYIRDNCRPDRQLSEHLSGYEKVVGVTLQWTSERRLISFVCEAAQLDPDIFYMLIPRQPQEEKYANMVLPQNVEVIRDKNFYELMAYCCFHSTVNSTCALEAPALGVQNILVDIDGAARAYYAKVLRDERVTRFANSPRGYVDIIRDFARLDREAVCKLHEGFFAPNYLENIRSFVKTHLP